MRHPDLRQPRPLALLLGGGTVLHVPYGAHHRGPQHGDQLGPDQGLLGVVISNMDQMNVASKIKMLLWI